jgi:hypothetical protein
MNERKSGYDPATQICWQFRNKGDRTWRCKCPAHTYKGTGRELSALVGVAPANAGSGRRIFHWQSSQRWNLVGPTVRSLRLRPPWQRCSNCGSSDCRCWAEAKYLIELNDVRDIAELKPHIGRTCHPCDHMQLKD